MTATTLPRGSTTRPALGRWNDRRAGPLAGRWNRRLGLCALAAFGSFLVLSQAADMVPEAELASMRAVAERHAALLDAAPSR